MEALSEWDHEVFGGLYILLCGIVGVYIFSSAAGDNKFTTTKLRIGAALDGEGEKFRLQMQKALVMVERS